MADYGQWGQPQGGNQYNFDVPDFGQELWVEIIGQMTRHSPGILFFPGTFNRSTTPITILNHNNSSSRRMDHPLEEEWALHQPTTTNITETTIQIRTRAKCLLQRPCPWIPPVARARTATLEAARTLTMSRHCSRVRFYSSSSCDWETYSCSSFLFDCRAGN